MNDAGTDGSYGNSYCYDIPITYIEQLNQGTTPDYTLTRLSNVSVSQSGNTVTITGTLNQDSGELIVAASAYEYFRDTNGFTTGFERAGYQIVVLNSAYFSEGDNLYLPDGYNNVDAIPTPDSISQEETPQELHVGIIEAVQLSDSVIQQLADNINVDKSEIYLLTDDDFTTDTPREPTQAMRDQVANDGYEFAAKLNEIKVPKDGYYVFQVTVSDDLVGANVSDLKLYYAEDTEFNTASLSSWEKVKSAFGLLPVINGISGSLEASSIAGIKLDTLPKQFLATMFLSSSKSMTVYVVKILLALLGGCNVGFGIAGVALAGFVIVKFRKRKRK